MDKPNVTKELRDILDSENRTKNINETEEEEVMSKLDDAKAKQAAREAQNAGGTPEVVKEETAATDVPATDAGEPSTEDTMKALLEQAKNEQESDITETGKTNIFQDQAGAGLGNFADKGELSDEEKQAQAKKDAAKREKELKTSQYNQAIESHMSQLKQNVKAGELSLAQKEFQAACSKFYVLDGIIMEHGEAPEIGIARTWSTQDKKPVYRPGVTQSEIDTLLVPKQKSVKRGNVQQFTTKLKYGYSKPKKFVGAVITIPQALNIGIEAYQRSEFKLPSGTEIANSPKITLPVDYDTLYTYVVMFCGGEIREASYMKEAAFVGANMAGKIKASIAIASTTVGGKKVSVNRRVFSASNRTSLWVKENIIPIKTYITEEMKALSAETVAAYNEMFKKALSAKTDEKYAFVDALDALSRKLISAETENGKVNNLSCAFLNGKAIFGVGEFEALGLQHWSRSFRDADGKTKQEIVSSNPLVKYQAVPNKQDATKINYKKVYKMLGDNTTLKELGEMGYTAAGIVAKLKVTEDAILGLYKNYLERQRKAREQKALAAGNTTSTRRRNNIVDNDLAAQLLLESIAGKSGVDLGMDVADVRSSMMSNAYEVQA